jgi:hypothetical protein
LNKRPGEKKAAGASLAAQMVHHSSDYPMKNIKATMRDDERILSLLEELMKTEYYELLVRRFTHKQSQKISMGWTFYHVLIDKR